MEEDPTLFDALVQYEFVVRGDDHQMPSCLSIFEIRRNEGKIWSSLLNMAKANGTPAGDETWLIQVGYGVLRTATGCSARALERAWPRLLQWGFLERIEEHHNRTCKKYIVRSEARVDADFKQKGPLLLCAAFSKLNWLQCLRFELKFCKKRVSGTPPGTSPGIVEPASGTCKNIESRRSRKPARPNFSNMQIL